MAPLRLSLTPWPPWRSPLAPLVKRKEVKNPKTGQQIFKKRRQTHTCNDLKNVAYPMKSVSKTAPTTPLEFRELHRLPPRILPPLEFRELHRLPPSNSKNFRFPRSKKSVALPRPPYEKFLATGLLSSLLLPLNWKVENLLVLNKYLKHQPHSIEFINIKSYDQHSIDANWGKIDSLVNLYFFVKSVWAINLWTIYF